MDNYTRDFVINKDTKAYTDSEYLMKRFNNMIENVDKMINQGPIYTPWIRLQLGKQDNILDFNTSTKDTNQNLIVSLTNEKTGSGLANKFTIQIVYDPFKNGQNPSDKLEALDELISDAMSYDADDDDDNYEQSLLRAYVQYGYNTTGMEDTDLVSPRYELFVTNIENNIQWATGITTYTIDGYSLIATDCNFVEDIEAFNGDTSLMDIVMKLLYRYYGDPDNKPDNAPNNVEIYKNSPKYKIDIPQELFDDTQDIKPIKKATPNTSPLQYCINILNENPYTKSDNDSDEYNEEKIDRDKLKQTEIPKYNVYITDSDRTIHVTHVSPLRDGNTIYDSKLKVNRTFTWGLQNSNLVTNWNSKVDLRYYAIMKANKRRAGETVTLYTTKLNEQGQDKEVRKEYAEKLHKALQAYRQDIVEMYESTLTLVGIPADVPIGGLVKVLPRVLQSESRQKGEYMITGSTDTISSSGLFNTELTLLRLKGLQS